MSAPQPPDGTQPGPDDERPADGQQEARECLASLSGNCLQESEGWSAACLPEDGCVHAGLYAPVGGQDGRRCPHCRGNLTGRAEADLVWRGDDDRPYCSAECASAAHTTLKVPPRAPSPPSSQGLRGTDAAREGVRRARGDDAAPQQPITFANDPTGDPT